MTEMGQIERLPPTRLNAQAVRVHRPSWRRSRGVADGGARAAAGNAGDQSKRVLGGGRPSCFRLPAWSVC